MSLNPEQVTLGEILLPYDAAHELDPVEWAAVSAEAHAKALEEISELKRKLDGNQSIIDKLNAQLKDFVKTKDEQEKVMLKQFMALLNEKKRKIRDQQRLLSTAKVDRTAATSVQSSRETSRKAGPSREIKRKASEKSTVAQQESEPDADQMEVDQLKAEEQESESDDDVDSAGPATPDRATEEETDDEVPAERKQKVTRGTKASATASRDPLSPKQPPPVRELPFGRPANRSRAPAKQPSPPEEEGETDDEEL
jgi:hypothetical protein